MNNKLESAPLIQLRCILELMDEELQHLDENSLSFKKTILTEIRRRNSLIVNFHDAHQLAFQLSCQVNKVCDVKVQYRIRHRFINPLDISRVEWQLRGEVRFKTIEEECHYRQVQGIRKKLSNEFAELYGLQEIRIHEHKDYPI